MIESLSKSIIDITVDFESYHFSCSFNRRINVIIGDSAAGKTFLVNLIETKSPDIKVNTTLPIIVVTNSTWKPILENQKKAILIFDDLDCTESLEFVSLCKKYLVTNDLYLIIINRSDLRNFKNEERSEIHLSKRLAISVDSIFEFKNNGDTTYWLEPYYKAESFDHYDKIVTEDSGNGFRFLTHHFNNVETSAGKAGIISKVLEVNTENSHILVLADRAAFGCHLFDFVRKLQLEHVTAVIPDFYESFEFMLLCSNMLKDHPIVVNEMSDLPNYANKFLSWENYFEDLVERATYKRSYRITHGRHAILSSCYFNSCLECNAHIKAKCDSDIQKLDKCKLKALFENTDFEWLLKLSDDKKKVSKDVCTDSMEYFEK